MEVSAYWIYSSKKARRKTADMKLDISSINCIKEIFIEIDPMFQPYAKILKQKLLVANNLKKNVPMDSEYVKDYITFTHVFSSRCIHYYFFAWPKLA